MTGKNNIKSQMHKIRHLYNNIKNSQKYNPKTELKIKEIFHIWKLCNKKKLTCFYYNIHCKNDNNRQNILYIKVFF